MSVIPEGALHAHKNHMEGAGEDFTAKGIPVVDNKGKQQAEIERNEIIFRKEVTDKIEELYKKYTDYEYSQKEKDTFIVGTEDYGIFVYWCIVEWKSVYSITIQRDTHNGRRVDHSNKDKVDRFYNAFWLTIVLNDKKKKHAIVHLFHDDLLSFITYLKTKVPNVMIHSYEITLSEQSSGVKDDIYGKD